MSAGYCNSCGEEMDEADDCCDDGEWMPYDNDLAAAAPETGETPDHE